MSSQTQPNTNNMIIRLFYSTRCGECMNMLSVIKNEDIMNIFKLICLDNMSAEQCSKLQINEIPAIVISDAIHKPSIFEGPQRCSQWLNNFTINRRKNMIQQVEQQRRLIQKAHIEAREKEGGPLEYNEAEMSGMTDNYSYHNTELAQPKNFALIGSEQNINISTPQINETKIDRNQMNKNLKDIEYKRKQENTEIISLMEREQINTIVSKKYS